MSKLLCSVVALHVPGLSVSSSVVKVAAATILSAQLATGHMLRLSGPRTAAEHDVSLGSMKLIMSLPEVLM